MSMSVCPQQHQDIQFYFHLFFNFIWPLSNLEKKRNVTEVKKPEKYAGIRSFWFKVSEQLTT